MILSTQENTYQELNECKKASHSIRKMDDKFETFYGAKQNNYSIIDLDENREIDVENLMKSKINTKFPKTTHESLIKSLHQKQNSTYGYY